MKRLILHLSVALFLAAGFSSCRGASKPVTQEAASSAKGVVLGSFDKDSAYQYIADQVAFGPRVPGTEGHDKCAEYLIGTLQRFGADTVMTQEAVVGAFNGDKLSIKNIFARFNSDAPNRVLLVAHWDTRPWANMESREEDRVKPIPGANDGGSGVGVILEIARNLGMKKADCGVDILFTDAEDYGNNSGFNYNDKSWCLGAQHWVENMPYTTVNRPAYGILLDMVGGTDARFHRELVSHREARTPTVKVWGEAHNLGFGDIFVNKVGGAVVDDHVFINRAGIPTTDIIEHMSDVTGNFPATWHTLADDMDHISTATLDAVGKTVLNVIYKEKEI